jgi:hypothetical protein
MRPHLEVAIFWRRGGAESPEPVGILPRSGLRWSDRKAEMLPPGRARLLTKPSPMGITDLDEYDWYIDRHGFERQPPDY